jgi:signal peptidase II
MASTWRARALFLGSVVCLVGCDHASKLAAEAALRHRAPVEIVPGVFDLRYAENRDIAFNALARLSLRVPSWMLTAFAAAAAAAMGIAWLRRRDAGWQEQAGFALVCAGALGNGLDRLLQGHVVDFLHVDYWPVFNIADVAIVAGLGLLALRRASSSGPRAQRPSSL